MELLPPTVEGLARAAELIRGGGLVAFPTETVYGLGADGLSGAAVVRIFEAKGRPADNPLILHLASPDAMDDVAYPDDRARRLAARFWPGPLTLVLPRRDVVPVEVSAGLGTVAVRMPDHPAALALLRAAGRPLAAPSANPAGRPSPTSARHVIDDMGGAIDAVLDGGECRVGIESTVLDLTRDPAVILRPGAVTPEELSALLGYLPLSENDPSSPLVSPGIRHQHYRPRCRVVLFEPDCAPHLAARDGILLFATRASSGTPLFSARPKTLDEWAQRLYSLFREADAAGVETLYIERPPGAGIGRALRDRLERAAGLSKI